MVSNLTGKAKEAAHKLTYGLRAYNGRMIDSNDAKQIVEIMENCIADLDWDNYRQLLEATPDGQYTDMLNEARNNNKQRWQKDMAAKARSPVNNTTLNTKTIETDDEKQERLIKQEANFFFKKKPTHPRCNCGAGFTSFPNHHATFCSAYNSVTSHDFTD